MSVLLPSLSAGGPSLQPHASNSSLAAEQENLDERIQQAGPHKAKKERIENLNYMYFSFRTVLPKCFWFLKVCFTVRNLGNTHLDLHIY